MVIVDLEPLVLPVATEADFAALAAEKIADDTDNRYETRRNAGRYGR